jgi:putative intracellular protease/amidase
MKIAILLFPRLTALDAIGPYEVLQRLPGCEVVFVGAKRGEVRTENGRLGLSVDATLDEVPRPGVVVVPGGIGTRALLRDEAIGDWLRTAHETTEWTTSVCTGSLLLAAAGILDGVAATTHWAAMDVLGNLGAVPTDERVVERGKIITAAGVSSGIDMALTLAARLTDPVTAQAMQLYIEYDPQPPFDAGSVHKAGEAVLARVAELRDTTDG